MNQRLAGGWCTVCQRWTRFYAREDGFAGAEIGARLRISKGEPVCPFHKLVDERGVRLLLEERAIA